jgi:arylsulfatase A-like enzyme
MYDHAIRVPLLMRWPGVIPAGQRIPALVQLHDIAATVLAAAGLVSSARMAGSANLLPLSQGKVARLHNHVVCLYRNSGINDQKAYFDPPLNSSMLRDERFKLVLYHAVPEAGGEPGLQLFDLQNDPDERQNLAADPAYSEITTRLLGALADWLSRQAAALEGRGGAALPGADWKHAIDNRF